MASVPTIRPLLHNGLTNINPAGPQDTASSATPQALPFPQADPGLRSDMMARQNGLHQGHPKPPLSAEASLAVIDDLMTQLDSNADGLISQQEFAAGAVHGLQPQGPGNPPGARGGPGQGNPPGRMGGPGQGNPPGAMGGPGRGNPRGPMGGPGGHANPAGMVGGPGQGNPPGRMGSPGQGNPPGAMGGTGRGNRSGPGGAQGTLKSPEGLFERFDLGQDGSLNADEFAAMQTMKFIKDSFPNMEAFKGFLEQNGITPDVRVDKAQADALREARLAATQLGDVFTDEGGVFTDVVDVVKDVADTIK